MPSQKSLIKDHPEDFVVEVSQSGEQAVFSVTVHGGGGGSNPKITYQWFRNGTPLTEVPGLTGVTSASLKIRNDLCPLLAGRYVCQVTRVPKKLPETSTQKNNEAEEPQVDCSRDAYLTAIWSVPITPNSRKKPRITPSLIVAGAPVIGTGGTTGGCPGPYRAYINIAKPGGLPFKRDGTPRATSPEKLPIKWFGTKAGLVVSTCAEEEIIPDPTADDSYRFSIFFPAGGAHDLTKTYQLYLFGLK